MHERNHMNPPAVADGPPQPSPEGRASTVSHVIRRIHMFTALFLGPWMLMYALSTLVMTHREFVDSFYLSKKPTLTTERELDYSRSFPTNMTREEIGKQILQDIGLDGSHTVSGGRNGRP